MRWRADCSVKLWNRGGLLSLAIAALVASWCTGWLWLLLQATRTLPGIISFQPGIGAFELLEFPTGLPYRKVLLAIFLACMLPSLALGALRGWWDEKGRAREALVWPLREMSFWLPCIAWSIGGVMLALSVNSQDGSDLLIMAISIFVLLVSPFFCLNPSTLDAAVPTRWWRPAWPGVAAFWICLLVWLVYTLVSFIIGEAIGIISMQWLAMALWLLDVIISISVPALLIVVWLNRGKWRGIRNDFGSLRRNAFVGELFWQGLAIGVVIAVLASPLLVMAAQAVFVIPQYEQWASQSGSELPYLLKFQAGFFRANVVLLSLLAVPLGLYFLLAQGRLIRRHGVGTG